MASRVPALLLLAAASLPGQVIISGAGGVDNETYSTAISTTGGTTLSLGFIAEYLVVGGGGAGGTGGSSNDNLWGAGGGGAGGVLTGSLSLGAQSYTVTVGAGGAAASHSGGSTANGGSGTKSVFGGFEALGGGGGAGGNNSSTGGDGLAGGSGGGGGGDGLKAGGDGTDGQGFDGGTSRTSAGARAAGGGGGGASAAGQIGGPPNGHNSGVGGNGGAGLASSITGSSVTYGGGGGGGGRDINGGSTSAGGSGGAGGGGAGSGTGNATSGTDGLGGGGGGSGADGKGGDGGDGIVVVRYKGSSAGTGGTVSSGTGTAAGYTIHSFTTVGNAALNLSTLNLNSRLGSVVSSSVSGTGALNVDTQGTVLFTGSATHTGGTNLVAGNLILGNGGTSGSLGGDVSVSSGAWLQYDRSANATFSSLTGAGNLVKKGTGVLTLAGGTAFTGEIEIQAGRLQIGNSGALSTGTLKFNGGGLSSDSGAARTISNEIIVYDSGPLGNATNNGTLTLTGGVVLMSEVSTLTLASAVVISSSLSRGDLVKAGSGELTLSGDNSNWFGNVTLQAGGTLVGSSTALGAGTVTFGGGALSSNGTTARTVSNAVNISANTTLGNATNNGTLTLSGAVNLGGGIRTLTTASNVVISGTISNGDLVKNGSFSALTLSGDNSNWSGSLTLQAGAILVGSSTALGTGAVFLYGSSFSSDGTTARTFSNNVSILNNITLGHATNNGLLTLSGGIATRSSDTLTTESDVIFSGAITGTGFSKNGSGTLTLSGDSTGNSGNFAVTGGTLVVSGILGASTLTVSAGTLVLNGTIVAKNSNVYGPNVVGVSGGATITGSGTINGGLYVAGIHNPGNSPGIQTVTGDVSYGNDAAIYWELGANTVSNSPAVLFDQIVVGGNLDFLGAAMLYLSFNPVTTGGTVDWSDAFWLADRSWQVFDVAGTTTGLGNVTLSTQDWLDAQGDSFAAVLGGTFSLSQSGSDVFLNYSAIPEPSTYGLILGGLALALATHRRRVKKV